MKDRIHILLLIFPVFLLMGCAHVISKDLRARTDPSLTFAQVHQSPETYKGKTVIWGGEIVLTLNQKDGSTLLEIFQRPLDRWGEPKLIYPSEGRFLIRSEKYLDAYTFRKGRKITVAGEILGEKIQPLGEMDYRYPLLLCKQIYLWEEYYYPAYYYPYYDPWWGYPLWWRWGIGFHYYHH